MGKHSNKKRIFSFKNFLVVYIVILTILMVFSLIYVIKSLVSFESLQIENFLNKVMQDVSKNGISQYVDVSKLNISKYENQNANIDTEVSNVLNNAKFLYKLNNNSVDLNNPVYNVYVNDNLLFNVELNGENKLTKLGILTVQDWKLNEIKLADENGLYECNIEVPSNLKIYVNNKEVDESEKAEDQLDEGLTELAKYAEIPYMVRYNISGLLKEPDVKLQDKNGKTVEYTKDDNTYKVELEYEEIEDAQIALIKIKGSIDILKIAKDWSLYLSNDLSGKTNGFYSINKYLIKDSNMWNYAYQWATNVDITFISSHVLLDPTFTNTKVSNFKIYSDKAFSTEVYLDKNMKLKNGKLVTDTMNERMYFAYYEGMWKLVNMQSIKK